MSSPSIAPGRNVPVLSRAIPMTWMLLLALAVHGPLLLMQLPNNSYDANLHKFFAAHYAQHWFDPWNPKWFTGFSQTTYPPLVHQWMALLSQVMGLSLAYMLAQFIAILLLPIGVYRFARIWVGERASSYAAIASIFIGSLSFLVYQAGQLPNTLAAALLLNALPYFYEWSRDANWRSMLKGLALVFASASAHHVTLLFGAVLFALPVLFTAIIDRKRDGVDASVGGVMSRSIIFGVLMVAGLGVVLLPFWLALYHNPIKQMAIPHASRSNFLSDIEYGLNYWIVPMGALILALPFIFIRGLGEKRFRPLFYGFWLTMIFGLGGTTPLPKWLLGRSYEVLTFERFTFWASLMALPLVGLLAVILIDRYGRKAIVSLAVLAASTMAMAVSWPVYHQMHEAPFNVNEVIAFLNRDGHDKFRYLTLGFGNQLSQVGTYANAGSVDGEYNSARLLPELTRYGSAQLTNAKYYGTGGMEALRAVLKHADQYGLKYVFVRDSYYEPLLAFAGWRKEEVYDHGNVTLWAKEGILPAHETQFGARPTVWEGQLWGTLPIGSSIVALLLVFTLSGRRRRTEPLEFPAIAETEQHVLREAR
jgi:hypothetical protein